MNRSYYCLDCERGFNTNDRTNHTCQGSRCSACGRFDCQDYVRGTRPSKYCTLCHCKFYGAYCKRHHVVTKQCQSVKTCLKCQAKYTVVPDRRHKCGHAKCPVCQEWVSIHDHKCYIQPVVEEEEHEQTEEGGGCMVAPPPPLFVYADFEAMQNAEEVFVANLLCYSSTEEETIHVLEGEDCALQFFHDLDDLVDVPESDGEREILVVFHNLKGFDGMFILHELYQQQREVVEQLTLEAKVLSFMSGPLKFVVLLAHAAGLFSKHLQFDGIEEGVLSSSVQYPRQPTVRGSNRRFGILRSRWHDGQKERGTDPLDRRPSSSQCVL